MNASNRARRPVTVVISTVAAIAMGATLAMPAAAAPSRVQPSNGKWGGTHSSLACNSVPAPDSSSNAVPDGLTCPDANIEHDEETVAFTLAGRHITKMSFDVEIQCLSSPDGTNPSVWQGTVMSYRPSTFGYTSSTGSTAIPANGLMRISFPVDDSLDYPAGTVQATFDFRGAKAKVAVYYKGSSTDAATGTWVKCYSAMNVPGVFRVTKLGR